MGAESGRQHGFQRVESNFDMSSLLATSCLDAVLLDSASILLPVSSHGVSGVWTAGRPARAAWYRAKRREPTEKRESHARAI